MFLNPNILRFDIISKQEFNEAYYSALQYVKAYQLEMNSNPQTRQTKYEEKKNDSKFEEFNVFLQKCLKKNNPIGERSSFFRQEESNKTNIISELELYKREMETYIGANEDLVEWWKRKKSLYPNLYQISRDILSCQATSAPTESMFSKARFFWRPDRNKIESNKF